MPPSTDRCHELGPCASGSRLLGSLKMQPSVRLLELQRLRVGPDADLSRNHLDLTLANRPSRALLKACARSEFLGETSQAVSPPGGALSASSRGLHAPPARASAASGPACRRVGATASAPDVMLRTVYCGGHDTLTPLHAAEVSIRRNKYPYCTIFNCYLFYIDEKNIVYTGYLRKTY
eukprot:6183341-Pleurochrysis_carterae.AAC.1